MKPEGFDADYLRTLYPGFRLDWSGLRNRLDDALALIEKQTTYEMRSANLDEIARVFEEGISGALLAERLKEREACAQIATEAQKMREELYEQNFASINAHKAVQAEEIAQAIRSRP